MLRLEPPWVLEGTSRRETDQGVMETVTTSSHVTLQMAGPREKGDQMRSQIAEIAASMVPVE